MSADAPAPTGSRRPYGVELLCEREPPWNRGALSRAVRKHCPWVDEPDGAIGTHFFHAKCPALEGGALYAQTVVMKADEPPSLDSLAPAVRQSWRFDAAGDVARRARHTVLVTDLMSSNVAPQLRIELVQRVLAGVLEVVPAIGLRWMASEQITDPQEFIEGMLRGEWASPQYGALNARMFRIAGQGDRALPNDARDTLMDTLGLSALGLPDLQCHFRNLDPQAVARVLLNTALYVYENGPVIESGHTVQGTTPGSKWRCQYEDSLGAPSRTVIDLDPGVPFAAGNRRG